MRASKSECKDHNIFLEIGAYFFFFLPRSCSSDFDCEGGGGDNL